MRSLDSCLATIEAYVEWYERIVLGCSTDRWLSLRNVDDFNSWLEESENHQNSGVGLITRFGRSIELQKLGKGASNLLSAGCYYDPERWQPPYDERNVLDSGRLLRRRNEGSIALLPSRDHRACSPFMVQGLRWRDDTRGRGKRSRIIGPIAIDTRSPRLRATGERLSNWVR